MNAPVLDEQTLLETIEFAKRHRKTVAFANGVFDVLHVGHVRYLQAAAREADILVVGVNSDASVRAIKGPSRPVVNERERAELVSSIRGVSYVTIFSDSSPARLLGVLKPDVHCKGTDYTPDNVPERDVVRGYGGRVAIVGDPKDHSTTDILEKMRKQ